MESYSEGIGVDLICNGSHLLSDGRRKKGVDYQAKSCMRDAACI